jgi:hypothetical protein
MSARAFDQGFSGFALRIVEGEERRVGFRSPYGFFERDEELVAALRRIADVQDELVSWVSLDSRVGPGDAGDLVTGGNGESELRGSPCTTRTSASAAMRRSDSLTVKSVFRLERKRACAARWEVATSRVVHQTKRFVREREWLRWRFGRWRKSGW